MTEFTISETEFVPDAQIMAMADAVSKAALKAQLVESKPYQVPGSPMPDIRMEIIEAIPSRFRWFTERNPNTLSAPFEQLRLVDSALTGAYPDIVATSQDQMRDWSGLAATQFSEKFLNHLVPTRDRQKTVVESLGRGLKGYWQILATSRADIMKIGEKTIEDLGKITDNYKGGSEFTMAMATVGISIGAAFGSGALAFTLTMGSGGLDALSTVLAAFDKDWVEGGSVYEILCSMEDQIAALRGATAAREDQLASVLSPLLERVRASLSVTDVAGAPTVSDANSGTALFVNRPMIADISPTNPVDFTYKYA